MKVLVCGGRDYYEFYTQSDAEAVIENLKNNIAAKDKLIQSLIDFDSEEVKRLEADNKRLREEIAAVLNSAALQIEGICTAVNSRLIQSLVGKEAHEIAAIIAESDLQIGAEIRALSAQPS